VRRVHRIHRGGTLATRLRRLATTAIVATSALGLTSLPNHDAEATTMAPLLELSSLSDEGEIIRFGNDGWIDFSGLGLAVDAPNRTFEIQARRAYGGDMTLELVRRLRDGRVIRRQLPANLARGGFEGLRGFFRVQLVETDGDIALDERMDFCPNNYDATRINPLGPTDNRFPQMCSSSTWTKGMTYGIDRGWSVPALFGFGGDPGGNPLDVPDGRYRLKMWITSDWKAALALPSATSRISIDVNIHTVSFECPPFCDLGVRSTPGLRTTYSTIDQTRPNGRSTYTTIDPNTLPDLRALPAWQMSTANDGGRDYLNFSANVWNGGPSPLVVEGFRRRGQNVMDAHQFFYRNGKPVGSRIVGEMMYHAGGGHDHWHFQDFAQYELTGADRSDIQRSGKEAFCLAPTDAIDLTIRRAEFRPGDTGLGSACGGINARWIREVLPAGWGDTYGQYLAGQAFDITDLPNGTYFVKVVANPDGRIIERTSVNNVSYRKVVLGGVPGERTVTVPPYRGIDTELGFGFAG
jgi:Lysyl oxidase